MDILSVEEVTEHIVETNEPDYPTFRRRGAHGWENLMGSSWEEHYDCEELEAKFQAFTGGTVEHDVSK